MQWVWICGAGAKWGRGPVDLGTEIYWASVEQISRNCQLRQLKKLRLVDFQRSFTMVDVKFLSNGKILDREGHEFLI